MEINGQKDIRDPIEELARAITPNCTGSRDATDGYVKSLTEAVMGVTAGLCEIASAIRDFNGIMQETWGD